MRRILRRHVDPARPEPAPMGGRSDRRYRAAGILQRSITELSTPGLAESTKLSKRRQGKRAPYNVLIDTGYLRASVSFEVNVGADADE